MGYWRGLGRGGHTMQYTSQMCLWTVLLVEGPRIPRANARACDRGHTYGGACHMPSPFTFFPPAPELQLWMYSVFPIMHLSPATVSSIWSGPTVCKGNRSPALAVSVQGLSPRAGGHDECGLGYTSTWTVSVQLIAVNSLSKMQKSVYVYIQICVYICSDILFAHSTSRAPSLAAQCLIN